MTLAFIYLIDFSECVTYEATRLWKNTTMSKSIALLLLSKQHSEVHFVRKCLNVLASGIVSNKMKYKTSLC